MCKLKNISVYKFISTIMWISAANFKQLKTVLYKRYKCCYFSTLWGSKSVCYISKFAIITELIISKIFYKDLLRILQETPTKFHYISSYLTSFTVSAIKQ